VAGERVHLRVADATDVAEDVAPLLVVAARRVLTEQRDAVLRAARLVVDPVVPSVLGRPPFSVVRIRSSARWNGRKFWKSRLWAPTRSKYPASPSTAVR
jgi:hypothetical protein